MKLVGLHRRGRRRMEDIPNARLCSVIGTCLTLEDLRKVARKAGLRLPSDADDFMVHGAVVSQAGSFPVLSKMLTRLLDSRFVAAINRFAPATTEADLAALWDAAVEAGDIPAAYWALMTHPLDCAELRVRAYGEVHMLSHISGASQRVDLRRIARLEADLAERTATVTALTADRADLRDRLVEAERRAGRADLLARRVADLEQRLAELESDAILRGLRADLAAAQRANAEQADRLSAAEAALTAQRTATEDAEGTARALAGRVADLELRLRERVRQEQAKASPPPLPDLDRRRILLVGGKPNTLRHLEALVSRCNGELIHHDGGLEQGCPRLACAVSRCDTVLCAVTCVSHQAVDHLKKNCQRACKSFLPLPGHSISAMERALRLIAVDADKASDGQPGLPSALGRTSHGPNTAA